MARSLVCTTHGVQVFILLEYLQETKLDKYTITVQCLGTLEYIRRFLALM